MESLFPQIKTSTRSEYEELSNNGLPLGYNILNFWKWSMSDVLSNATRGLFAEFIVATAVGFEPSSVRDEWGDYDLTADNGKIKIEVKSSAFIQSWEQKELSKIIFSTKSRKSDIYVFCLLKHTDQSTIDPLKMEQWEFYILSTLTLNNYKRSKTHITLNSLRGLANPTLYENLKQSILNTFYNDNTTA